MGEMQNNNYLVAGDEPGNEIRMDWEVTALSWDISLGVSTSRLGQLYLRRTSERKEVAPSSIDHVGIYAFGVIYEYGDFGILRTKVPDDHNDKFVSKYPVLSLSGVDKMGRTKRTKEEFEKWVGDQQIGNFKSSDYHVVNYNCILWAIGACKFLGVPHPKNWDLIQKYAKNHIGIASFLGSIITTTRKMHATFSVVFPFASLGGG